MLAAPRPVGALVRHTRHRRRHARPADGDAWRSASPRSARWRPFGSPRFAVASLHRSLSLLAVALLAAHIVTTCSTRSRGSPVAAAVVPFATSYRPLWVGLGAIAIDLLVASSSQASPAAASATARGAACIGRLRVLAGRAAHGLGTGRRPHLVDAGADDRLRRRSSRPSPDGLAAASEAARTRRAARRRSRAGAAAPRCGPQGPLARAGRAGPARRPAAHCVGRTGRRPAPRPPASGVEHPVPARSRGTLARRRERRDRAWCGTAGA